MSPSSLADPLPSDGAIAIGLERVSFRYAGQSEWALRDISMTVHGGEMVTIMGPSGAGKTTLAKCLNRTIPAFHRGELSGAVNIAGKLCSAADGVGELAGVVALVSQDFEAQLFATNVAQEVVFGMEQLGVPPTEMRERLAATLAVVGLEGFERRDPTTLSGGEKQRLAIAATIALAPRILVLDEPTTDLDPVGKAEVLSLLAKMRREGMTLVVVEHEIAAAELADRLIVLAAGAIAVDAPPREVLNDAALLAEHAIRAPDLTLLASRVGISIPPAQPRATTLEALRQRRRLQPAPISPAPAGEREALVRLEGVEFEYETGTKVLQHAELEICAGEAIAIIGQNGSGKTTLAKHFNGLLRPSRGRVIVDGRTLRDVATHEIAATVGYVFQNPDSQIFAASVEDEIAFGPVNLGLPDAAVRERVEWALAQVELEQVRHEDPFVLSKGQRQRLAIASVLALQPRMIVLDEPTTGLDYREQLEVLQLLKRMHDAGTTVVIITHSPWIASELAERGILLEHGRIIFDGRLQALLARDDLLRQARFVAPDIRAIAQELGIEGGTVEAVAAHFDAPPA